MRGAWLAVGASNGVLGGGAWTSSTESSFTSSKVRSGRGGRGDRFGVGGGGGSWSAQSRPTTSSAQQKQEVPAPGLGAVIVSYRCIAIVLCVYGCVGQRYAGFCRTYGQPFSASVHVAS